MKAFSLWQPWASLWCSPRKRHETRGQGSNFERDYRGWLAVHATKKFVRDVDPDLEEILIDEFGPHWGRELPTGAIIGAVNTVAVLASDGLFPPGCYRRLSAEQRDDFHCGDFDPGRFAIERREYVVLPEPIPWSGQQGRYFDVPDFPALQALIDRTTRAVKEAVDG